VKVVILCGGKGTRIREETEYRPKPLVEIGGRPILWHIMKLYSTHGYREFVLCLGYKGEMIKKYFLNYGPLNADFTIDVSSGEVVFHDAHKEDWVVTLADTGKEAMTGARLKRVERYIDSDSFMVTYGDGVANLNIKKLVEFHKKHGRIGTVTGVRPSSRFGELVVEGDKAMEFREKPQVQEGVINGGFFVFNKDFFDYLSNDDSCTLEREPLENLAADGELMVYLHKGFWQCMDTYRDFKLLNDLWSRGPPWKIWR
jgi:glucose-1-phosphate cytidylyltransferase